MPSPDNSVHQSTTAENATAAQIGNNPTDRRPTVLESHGYVLGKTIGSGSYATVRVNAFLYYVKCSMICRTRFITKKHLKKNNFLGCNQ